MFAKPNSTIVIVVVMLGELWWFRIVSWCVPNTREDEHFKRENHWFSREALRRRNSV